MVLAALELQSVAELPRNTQGSGETTMYTCRSPSEHRYYSSMQTSLPTGFVYGGMEGGAKSEVHLHANLFFRIIRDSRSCRLSVTSLCRRSGESFLNQHLLVELLEQSRGDEVGSIDSKFAC